MLCNVDQKGKRHTEHYSRRVKYMYADVFGEENAHIKELSVDGQMDGDNSGTGMRCGWWSGQEGVIDEGVLLYVVRMA